MSFQAYIDNVESKTGKSAEELKSLAIDKGLADCKTRTLICGGHFAFGHFAERYGLRHLSPYAGFSPDAQPSPRALAQLVHTLRETGATAVFYEEILDPRLARVLADETGGTTYYVLQDLLGSTSALANSGLRPPRSRRHGVLDQLQRFTAIRGADHSSSSFPQSASAFFRNTSRAAVSASAASLRRSSRSSCLMRFFAAFSSSRSRRVLLG